MRFLTKFALANALSFGVVQAEDWNLWPGCEYPKSNRRLQEEQDGNKLHAKQTNFPDYQSARQIITYDTTDGKLHLNEESVFYADDLETDEVIHVILLWGEQQAGKSTLGSFLHNSMKPENNQQFQFKPSRVGVPTEYTEGVWVTPTFDYTGINEFGEEETRKYVIVDSQSLFVSDHQGGFTQDWSYKTVALFTELASIFLYMSNSHSPGFTPDDFSKVGIAMASTREHMVRNARRMDDSGNFDLNFPENEEAGLSSINHAGLIMGKFQEFTSEIVEEHAFVYDRTAGLEDALNLFESMPDDQSMAMLENFKAVPHEGGKVAPFHQFEFPFLDGRGTPESMEFTAHRVAVPPTNFYDETRTSATVLSDMAAGEHKCRWGNFQHPSNPATFKLSLEYLAELIHGYAPTRMVTRAAGDPLPLTGRRFKEILKNGIAEMNAIGPLPQASLWRKVIEDRCEFELVDHVDFTLGARQGKIDVDGSLQESQGKLLQLERILDNYFDGAEGTNIANLDTRWVDYTAQYWSSQNLSDTVEDFFTGRSLMSAVKDRCSRAGLLRQEVLDATYTGLDQRQAAMYQSYRRIEAEKEAAALQKQIEGLEYDLWLQEWRYRLIIAAIVGSVLCLVFSRLFGQFSSVCSFCLVCTGNTGDTSESLIIVKGDNHAGLHYNQTGVGGAAAAGVASLSAGGYHGEPIGPPKLATARVSNVPGLEECLESQGLSPQARLDLLNSKLMDLENR